MAHAADVPKLYQSVVDDVINNVREAFLDDGVDEQILVELKQLWENKLNQSKVLQAAKPVAPRIVTINPALQRVTTQQPLTHHPQPQTAVYQETQQLPVMNHSRAGLIEMSSAAQAATIALPAGLYQPQLLQGGTITLTQGGQQYIIQTAPGQLLQTAQPTVVNPNTILPQTHTAINPQAVRGMVQLDGPQGPQDSSSDDDDDDDDNGDKDDDDDDDQDDEENEAGEEEEPLNSGDDVSEDEDPSEIFDTENVIVCQFDRINRNKNKWKFTLKDGIMNLNGRDYVFQKATGESEW